MKKYNSIIRLDSQEMYKPLRKYYELKAKSSSYALLKNLPDEKMFDDKEFIKNKLRSMECFDVLSEDKSKLIETVMLKDFIFKYFGIDEDILIILDGEIV